MCCKQKCSLLQLWGWALGRLIYEAGLLCLGNHQCPTSWSPPDCLAHESQKRWVPVRSGVVVLDTDLQSGLVNSSASVFSVELLHVSELKTTSGLLTVQTSEYHMKTRSSKTPGVYRTLDFSHLQVFLSLKWAFCQTFCSHDILTCWRETSETRRTKSSPTSIIKTTLWLNLQV